jgi:hypothetical protein
MRMPQMPNLAIAILSGLMAFADCCHAGSPSPPRDVPFPGPNDDFWKDEPRITVDHNVMGSDVIWFAGQVANDSADLFKQALDDNNIAPGATVMFQSPGGNAIQGMQIGRLIRERSLRTSVGKRPSSGPNQDRVADSGLCISACSVAFLGGVVRSVPPGSYYVIHTIAPMIKSKKEPNRRDPFPTLSPEEKYIIGVRIGERAMAVPSIAYLSEMGIDLGWYVEATKWDTENHETYWASNDELLKWRVVATAPDTKWELVPKDGKVYLVGKSPGSTPNSGWQNVLSFVCKEPNILQMSVYYVPNNDDLVAKVVAYKIATPHAHSQGLGSAGDAPELLSIDPAWITEAFHSVGNGSGARIVGTMSVSAQIMSSLMSADDLNFRFYRADSSYQGFDVDFGTERDTFRRFVEVCAS